VAQFGINDKDGEERMKVEINPEEKYHVIDGKVYKISKQTVKKKSDHLSRVILVEVDKDEYDKRVTDIIDVIAPVLDVRDILRDILRDLPLNEIEKIERRILKKVEVKQKKGCVNLMIGDYELPISD